MEHERRRQEEVTVPRSPELMIHVFFDVYLLYVYCMSFVDRISCEMICNILMVCSDTSCIFTVLGTILIYSYLYTY